jgi:hypothetical protein
MHDQQEARTGLEELGGARATRWQMQMFKEGGAAIFMVLSKGSAWV